MVLGQGLLWVFVFLWLRGQYHQTSFELERDLGRIFSESTQQLQDTILKTKFVSPLLATRDVGTLTMEYEMTTNDMDTLVQVDVTNEPKFIQPLEFRYPDSTDRSETRIQRTYQMGDTSAEMLTDVVAVFFDEIAQKGDSSFRIFIYDQEGDSLLNNLLKAKLNAWNLNISHEIGRSKKVIPMPGSFEFASTIFGNPYHVKYGGTKQEIWMRIFPQITFSALLVLIIGLTFYLLLRNLKSQMRLNLLQRQFVANVSHELRTPISTVKVALESIKQYGGKNDQELAKDYLNIASGELNRLENMVSEVLTTSMVEGGEFKLQIENADLTELINQVVLLHNLDGKQMLTFEKPGSVFIDVDSVQIKSVLNNLIDNARKYGGGNQQIDISMNISNEIVHVYVCDKGPGIPKEFREKVFERFFRVPTGDVHNVKGYGLGLTFSREIMRLHGGELLYTDKSGWSSCFELQFPRK